MLAGHTIEQEREELNTQEDRLHVNVEDTADQEMNVLAPAAHGHPYFQGEGTTIST